MEEQFGLESNWGRSSFKETSASPRERTNGKTTRANVKKKSNFQAAPSSTPRLPSIGSGRGRR